MSMRHKLGGKTWFDYIKKYVWDEDKTPYFVAVNKLKQHQANNELFAYAGFIAILFTVVALAAFSTKSPFGRSYGIAFYGFSVAASAIMLHITKNIYPAIYCGLAAIVALLFCLLRAWQGEQATDNAVILIIFTGLWCWYSWRVVRIAQAYEFMASKELEQD